jgi:toxin secretion/phage lysis holin
MGEAFIICCIFILLDIISGIAAALKSKSLSSTVMREGLYNKLAEILLLLLSAVCNFVLDMPPFHQLGIPPEISYVVAAYVVCMEILSTIENICILNPDIPLAKLLMIFNIKLDKNDSIDIK